MLPATVSSLLASAAVVGFSGSRAPSPASLAAVQLVAAGLAPAVPVVVGDARGIDQHAAQLLPAARVFQASSFGIGHAPGINRPLSVRAQLVMRSIACVRACAGGVWCAFPAHACPADLRPARSSSACFNGSGSGTWASLAFAIGSGVAPLVFLPLSIVPPAAFGLVSAGQGWHVAGELGWAAPAPAGQLSFL